MSLLPLMNDLWIDDYRRPRLNDIYDQHFGLGLLNNETLTPLANYFLNPLRTGYLRPWRNLNVVESGVSSIRSDQNEFKVNLDVQQFKPEELKVKIADGFIIVEGKHEERSDQHGFVSRQFVRRYKVPEDIEEASILSSLSSDGVLTLKAPKKSVAVTEGREIPITTTLQPAVVPTTEKVEGSPL